MNWINNWVWIDEGNLDSGNILDKKLSDFDDGMIMYNKLGCFVATN